MSAHFLFVIVFTARTYSVKLFCKGLESNIFKHHVLHGTFYNAEHACYYRTTWWYDHVIYCPITCPGVFYSFYATASLTMIIFYSTKNDSM